MLEDGCCEAEAAGAAGFWPAPAPPDAAGFWTVVPTLMPPVTPGMGNCGLRGSKSGAGGIACCCGSDDADPGVAALLSLLLLLPLLVVVFTSIAESMYASDDAGKSMMKLSNDECDDMGTGVSGSKADDPSAVILLIIKLWSCEPGL